jgi:hypothetical protein
MLVLPDFLSPTSLVFFQDQLRSKGVRTILKPVDGA